MTSQKWCLSCDKPTTIDSYRCPNCGNGQLAQVSKSEFLNAHPDILEELDVACSECNSDLKKGQRYCSNCGIEIDWQVLPARGTQLNIEVTTSDARKRKYWVAIAVVVGIVVLLSLISSGANSKQEECVNMK